MNVEANVIREDNTTTDVDDLIESLEKEKECWVLENGKLLPARSPSKQDIASSKEEIKVRSIRENFRSKMIRSLHI